MSGAEQRHLAVASVSLGPWRPAAVVGALGGGVRVALHLVHGHFGLGVLSGAVSLAALLFFCVGGVGSVLGNSGRGAGRDHRIRRWARSHPWHVAALPAAGMFVTDLVVRQLLAGQGLLSTVWSGLWHGAVVAAVVGVVGSVAASRR
ncbi:hypothetical protein [Actinacidiphila sp. ITFR-21]|uniref:hypothetical protein n=1 Tax=Actinacidiphila sp. ITFR-21 TaxID=3075199 RepID=UPI00288C5546|nr:hypothetical protein [Streptomyces sp. ITFR-21]WNI17120.1 hypothetical protein RLT57_17410 [Streptomyces sp. ITFR-21]